MSNLPLRSVPEAERRNRLLELVRREAYMEGDFTLSSGAKSTFYLDCRLVTLHPVGSLLVASFVVGLLKKLHVTCVGGPTLAADPIVGASVALSPLWEWPCDGFIVRKATKDHGTGKLIEGRLTSGKPALVVEDVITSGGSVLAAIEAVREAGAEVTDLWALVDRQAGGVQKLEEAGVNVHCMFKLDEVQSFDLERASAAQAPWDRHWKGWKSDSEAGEGS